MSRGKLRFCVFMALVPVIMLTSAWLHPSGYFAVSGYDNEAGGLMAGVESIIAQSMPFHDELQRLGEKIAAAGGKREIIQRGYGYTAKQNGIFVGDGSLMKNIDPPVEAYVRENISGVTEFAEAMRQSRKQTYIALIPTSGAIMQQKLPRYASSVMVNQYQFIEDVYGRVSVNTTTIDAYSALIARQSQYIYYRTENNLTSLGGYYVYASMLARLGIGRAQLNQFDIDYANNSFYGDLYAGTGYTDALADSISLFRYSDSIRYPHEFLVTHTGSQETKTYHTLFPEHAATLGNELDVFLGGMSAITDIKAMSQYSARLLVFGDKTALAYIPFLANNCKQVTLVDLSCDKREFEGIDPFEYDKIIFAYGVESFMHTNNPAKVKAFLEEQA